MKASERREKILHILNNLARPIKGDELAEMLHISRQVIVQDIALIRAKGENIIATPQGYILYVKKESISQTIKCKNHSNTEEFYEELKTIVELGGSIKDVIVEHPMYGEIKVELNINSMRDINEFIKKASNEEFKQLSTLTKESHIHTIEASKYEILEEIMNELKERDILC
ncbi:MAG: 3H domain-containing protein [Peptostreptococcaceae bacterium]